MLHFDGLFSKLTFEFTPRNTAEETWAREYWLVGKAQYSWPTH